MPKPQHGPLRAALEVTVKALGLTDKHAAVVASARYLADLLDGLSEPDDSLLREYRMTLDRLIEAGAGGDDDGTEQIRLTFTTPRIRG